MDKENKQPILEETLVLDGAQPEPSVDDILAVTASVDDPLLSCLLLLTKLTHRPFSANALSAGLPLVNNRLTPDLFIRAARRAGMKAKILKRPISKISQFVLPVVLLLKNETACVLIKVDETNQQAVILDPDSDGERTVDLAKLESEYLGYTIFTRPQHDFDARTPELKGEKSEHWFWGTLASSWRIYRDVLFASFLVNVVAIASPLFVMNVYDRVVPNSAIETLWALSVGMFIVFFFDLFIKTLRGYFIEVAGKKSDVILSAKIFEKVMNLKMSVRPASVGAFASNLREFESIRAFITSSSISAFIDLPFSILFLIVIAYVGGVLVWVPIAIMPLILLYGYFVQFPLRKAVEQTFQSSAQKNATLIESLVGMETIKALGAESTTQRSWEASVGHIATWSQRSKLLSMSAINVASFLQQLGMVVIVIVGVYLIAERNLTVGGLVASVLLFNRAVSPMAQVASLIASFHQTKTALSSLDNIMSMPEERTDDTPFIHRERLEGDIEFKNVSFKYPGQDHESLSNVSFKIKQGERVALIGRIGSGKTTIAKLLLALYEPESGAVFVDGIDVKQIDPANLRANVGYVPQDIVLFYGSVKDNICYGSPYADDKEIVRAAESAGVDEFVNRHPKGFDMPVGERGSALSGGQRQAIAVARALLKAPPMYVMDEPSNAMDNSSEEWLRLRLRRRTEGKTLLLVTHKTSMLALVDRIIIMDQGKILVDGSKDAVLEALKNGKVKVARR